MEELKFDPELQRKKPKPVSCTRRECLVFQQLYKERLDKLTWMRDEMWKTQSYAGTGKLDISDEFRERAIAHPAFVSVGIMTPGLLQMYYLTTVTDEATLRKDLQLLPTDVVKFVGVAQRPVLTRE